MSDFYLVQRLNRRDSPYATGFDRLFSCQYMGAAEFEFGAIPASLKRLRGSDELVIHEGPVTRNGTTQTVYVVGDKAVVQTIPGRLTEWLSDRRPRGQEPSYFPEYVEGTEDKHRAADAWWALNEDVLWTLDGHLADVLLMAVQA